MSSTDKEPKPYRNADEIEVIVGRFEDCSLSAGEFHHREHVTVILWYLSKLTATEAAARMREGLHKFLDQHKVDRRKYHETITLFWVKRISALHAQVGKEHSLALIANEAVEVCGDAKLIYDYYSRELIATDAARQGWVEPDLQPLDF